MSGAKNAALGILAAAVMADETVTVENLPDIRDIDILLNAIASVGAVVERIDKHCVRINGGTVNTIIVANDGNFGFHRRNIPFKRFPIIFTNFSIESPSASITISAYFS